jgi:hypothetical protein
VQARFSVAHPIETDDDDRRRCEQFANLTKRGICLAAWRGEIVASRTYAPERDRLRRCEAYVLGPDDQDRRVGARALARPALVRNAKRKGA